MPFLGTGCLRQREKLFECVDKKWYMGKGRKGADVVLNKRQKESLRQELIDCLCQESEVKKIVIFGSFLHSSDPNDLDVAVFQDSSESYLPLAMKYRKKTRAIAQKIPLDIIPLKTGSGNASFLAEINQGEVIYER